MLLSTVRHLVGMLVDAAGTLGTPGSSGCIWGNTQVHPTSSSTVSEKSSLAAFGLEAESPAGLDKQAAMTPASQGGHSNRASAVTEITPADDTDHGDRSGGKMRQLTPELAGDGAPCHMVSIYIVCEPPCCVSKAACLL